MKKRQGFTLIELVMILVIVGIMAIVVIPGTTAQPIIRLQAASQKVASDLRYIQEMAMAQQVRFGVSFDAVNESYFGYRADISAKAKDPQARGDLDISFNQLNEFKGINIASTNFSSKVEFDSIGAPYDGNGVILSNQGIIILQAEGGAYSRTVRIEAKTGKVSIQ